MPTHTKEATEMVACSGCGEDVPLADARPAWIHDGEKREFCPDCEPSIECARCGGTGTIEIVHVGLTGHASPRTHTEPCPKCDGTGHQEAA